jgi:Icc protein
MATVLQISDTHLQAAAHTPVDKDPDARLLATIDAVRGVYADLILLTGDLADDGSTAALERLQTVVSTLGTPMLAIGGNHDLVPNVLAVFGPDDTAEVGAWRVVGVDSVIPGEIHGAVDVDELTRRLDGLDDRPTLIAIHHPPRSTSTHEMFQLIGAEEMLAALRARPHVRAVVSGHLHEVFDREDGDLRLWGAPSTYYAIEHHGDDYLLETDGLVGAQVLTLDDDGSISCERVVRSLGC